MMSDFQTTSPCKLFDITDCTLTGKLAHHNEQIKWFLLVVNYEREGHQKPQADYLFTCQPVSQVDMACLGSTLPILPPPT